MVVLGRERKKVEEREKEKILNIDASMQGTLSFRDPVNLNINGRFEGTLTTKGNLTIGKDALVNANITGDTITIAGKVTGDILALEALRLIAPAILNGNIKTPKLSMEDGAVFEGNCQMVFEKGEPISPASKENFLTVQELAKYLEVDNRSVLEWADSGRIPAIKEGDIWKFDKASIDEWVVNEKIK